MHLPELEFNGRGRVTGIDFCPAIAEGDGSVVIGRMVTYNASELARVTFAGGVELCGTLHHPVWSLDRAMWVGLSELEPGERVSCECVSGDGVGLTGEYGGYVTGKHGGYNSGIAVVEEVQLYTTSEPVYNLETHGEHVYEVTELGILVHNNNLICKEEYDRLKAKDPKDLTPDQKKKMSEYEKITQIGWTVIEEPKVTKALDKMGKGQRAKVDKLIDDIAHGRPGGNQHALSKDLKGDWAVDVPGTGKGRGAVRIIYQYTNNGIILKDITDYH